MAQQALIQSRGQHRENRSSLRCKATTSKDEQQEESMKFVLLGKCLQETALKRMLITD